MVRAFLAIALFPLASDALSRPLLIRQPRLASATDLPRIARLQLDAFDSEPERPAQAPSPLLSFFGGGSARDKRAERAQRIAAELEERVAKGSDLWVLEDQEEQVGQALLGTVDLSEQEMLLPTHGVAEGLYLSSMAVNATVRRQGIGRKLLQAAEERAEERGAPGIYLHVERANAAAIALYESSGFVQLANTPQLAGFTSALALAHKEPLLLYKNLQS